MEGIGLSAIFLLTQVNSFLFCNLGCVLCASHDLETMDMPLGTAQHYQPVTGTSIDGCNLVLAQGGGPWLMMQQWNTAWAARVWWLWEERNRRVDLIYYEQAGIGRIANMIG